MRLEDLIPNASSFLPGGIAKEASDFISDVYFFHNPKKRENREIVETIKRQDKIAGISAELVRDGSSLLVGLATKSYELALAQYLIATYICDRVIYSMKKDKWLFLM